MIAVIQRVDAARVRVSGETVGKCGAGLLVLAAVAVGDTICDCEALAEKISKLRIFSDSDGKLNLSVKDVGGEILAVSNFTLAASCRRGNRPDFANSAPYSDAERLFDVFVRRLRELDLNVETGVFGADMKVELCNDGPLTVILDSRELSKSRSK